MWSRVHLTFALLGLLCLLLALWPGKSNADPNPPIDWSDCKVTVRHSMGELKFLWEERYFATMRCDSDKPKPEDELRTLSVGTSRQGSVFADGGSCDLQREIKKGVTYPCVVNTSAFCLENERTRHPVARLLISRGGGFKVVAAAESSPMSLNCRFQLTRSFRLHFEVSAIKGREIARHPAARHSG